MRSMLSLCQLAYASLRLWAFARLRLAARSAFNFAFASLALASGCGGFEPVLPIVEDAEPRVGTLPPVDRRAARPEPKTLAETLQTPVTLSVSPESSALSVEVRSPMAPGETHRPDLRAESGELTLWAGREGRGGLSAEVRVSDLDVPEAYFPPRGLPIRDIRASFMPASPLELFWSEDGDHARLAGELDITVRWSVLREGKLTPLAPVEIEGVEIAGELDRTAEGELLVRVSGEVDGVFWRAGDLAEVSGLAFLIVAGTSR